MKEKISPSKQPSSTADIRYYIDLICVVMLGFVAVYMTLPTLGKWASLPVCILCGVAAGFTKLKWLLSAGIFALTSYFVASFFVGGFEYSITTAVFAALSLLAGCLAVKLLKSRGVLQIILAAVLLAAGCFGHFILFGSPLKSFPASEKLNAYINSAYDDTVSVSGMAYNRKNGAFYCNIRPEKNYTAEKTIYCDGDMITDNFRSYAQTELMSDARLKLQLALRDEFPNGKFNVISRSVSTFPENRISFAAQYEDITQMNFDINVTIALRTDDFARLAKSYTLALAGRDIRPASLRLRSGDSGKTFLSAETLPTQYPAPVRITYENGDLIAGYAAHEFASKTQGIDEFIMLRD